jgi:hypothetical protein
MNSDAHQLAPDVFGIRPTDPRDALTAVTGTRSDA